ncbi:MAG: thiol peroxidase [Sumerlaeia bacterium]
MPATTTLKGNPFKLEGTEVKAGDTAPNFSAHVSLVEKKSLSDFAGKTTVILAVPSLDTPVCDLMAKRFSEEAGKLGGSINVITISCDLPTAQKRWCGAASIDNLVCMSDYKDHEFGAAYGTFIPDLAVLSRAVFVVDGAGKLIHVEYVPEIADHPNYDAALAAAKA